MLVTTVTTIIFDPIQEYAAMKSFERENDMSEWIKSESTLSIAYTKTQRTVTTLPKQHIITNYDYQDAY